MTIRVSYSGFITTFKSNSIVLLQTRRLGFYGLGGYDPCHSQLRNTEFGSVCVLLISVNDKQLTLLSN